ILSLLLRYPSGVLFPAVSACFRLFRPLECSNAAPKRECCTMGTIVQRKRGDGTRGYMAQVRVKQKGAIVHAETKTFDRKQAASAWIARRETELREPGALERIKAVDPTLAEVIDRYVDESKRKIGRTKTQVLRTIKTFDIADMKCSTITSADIVSFAH